MEEGAPQVLGALGMTGVGGGTLRAGYWTIQRCARRGWGLGMTGRRCWVTDRKIGLRESDGHPSCGWELSKGQGSFTIVPAVWCTFGRFRRERGGKP